MSIPSFAVPIYEQDRPCATSGEKLQPGACASLPPLDIRLLRAMTFISVEQVSTACYVGGRVLFAPGPCEEWLLDMRPPGRVERITGKSILMLHKHLPTMGVPWFEPPVFRPCYWCGAPNQSGMRSDPSDDVLKPCCVYCRTRAGHIRSHRELGTYVAVMPGWPEIPAVGHEPDPLPDDCAWSTATWDEP